MPYAKWVGGAQLPAACSSIPYYGIHPAAMCREMHQRVATTSGQTAYERAFDSPYQGRICQFGEVVLAYVKSTKKGAPRWLKGIWLTKTLNHDAHVIALPSAIVCTRSVRRLSNQWDLARCGSLEQPPWEFGLATLGSKLVSAKRIIEPATLTYPIGNASGGEGSLFCTCAELA